MTSPFGRTSRRERSYIYASVVTTVEETTAEAVPGRRGRRRPFDPPAFGDQANGYLPVAVRLLCDKAPSTAGRCRYRRGRTSGLLSLTLLRRLCPAVLIKLELPRAIPAAIVPEQVADLTEAGSRTRPTGISKMTRENADRPASRHEMMMRS